MKVQNKITQISKINKITCKCLIVQSKFINNAIVLVIKEII